MRLADELVERPRAQPLREGRHLAGPLGGRIGEEVAHERKYAPLMVTTSLRTEVTELLSGLIKLDTTNPPGNETIAAEYLRAYLEAAGLECELIARSPERANLVTRIKGTGGGPSLLLLGHTDVVLADPAEWDVPPFSGEVRDGEVWGRGALDMKCQVAANAVAIASLAREGFKPSGDLIFVANADEENGVGFGLEWMCEAHPDAVRADFCVNEGAGDRLELGGNAYYLCSSAEKMSSPFTIRVHGRSGHASMPNIADNALVKAAVLIQRIAAYRPEPQMQQEVEGFLRAVLGEVPSAAHAVERAREVDRAAAELIEPLLAPTFSPTMITASQKRNVIPALVRGHRRLPHPARPDAAASRADDPRGPRRATSTTTSNGWRARAARGRRSTRRCGGRSSRSSPRSSPARAPCRSASPASRTATGCGTRSARSRTGSSRCGRCRPTSQRR